MIRENANVQKIYLNELNDYNIQESRKASRIELRTLRDAYNLRTNTDEMVPSINKEEIFHGELRRLSAYCTAESYRLKHLVSLLRENSKIDKIQLYFGECVYAGIKINGTVRDVFFIDYGVIVMWGLEENEEQDVLNMIKCIEGNPYDFKEIETERFQYGISKNSQIVNDMILLSEDNLHMKMVISIGIAQSVKLDYFEELVDNTIETVKELPDEVEKEGKVGKRRKDILRIMGKLHKLSFNLYLVSNILAEPEFVWEYSSFSPLYETCVRYLDIKSRSDLLNKRCEIIHGMLQILSENITTHNSEKLERTMTILIGISAVFGFIQCSVLLIFVFKYFSTNT